MYRTVGVGLLALLAVSLLLLSGSPDRAHAQQIRWHKSLSAALAESKKSGKPILLEFR